MSIADWATTISGALAVIAALGWIVKRYLVELKPNHGSSLRDAVDCIQRDISAISVDLAGAGKTVGKLPLIRLLQLCLTQSAVPIDFKVSCLLESVLPDHLKIGQAALSVVDDLLVIGLQATVLRLGSLGGVVVCASIIHHIDRCLVVLVPLPRKSG